MGFVLNTWRTRNRQRLSHVKIQLCSFKKQVHFVPHYLLDLWTSFVRNEVVMSPPHENLLLQIRHHYWLERARLLTQELTQGPFIKDVSSNFSFLTPPTYSSVPNRRAAQINAQVEKFQKKNKRAGGNKRAEENFSFKILIKAQDFGYN